MEQDQEAEQNQSLENMQTSEAPPRPKDRFCRWGCGRLISPEFLPPVVTLGRVMSFSNKWVFPVDICEKCAVVEAVNLAAQDAERAKRKERVKEEATMEKLAALFGGRKAAECYTLDAYNPKTPSQAEAVQACRSFSPERENLYLWGPTGGGKTHLSCGVAARSFREKRSVEFFKPGAFLRSLRMKEPSVQDKLFDRYARAAVFVLDDLGLGNSTDSSLGMFYELLDMRDMAGQNGLVVTSNLSLDGLASALKDDRLPSRLAGLCRVIHVEGPDGRIGRKK